MSSLSTWMWLLLLETVSILVGNVPCAYWRFSKRWRCHGSRRVRTAISLMTVGPPSLVGVSLVRFSGRTAFERNERDRDDSWTPILICRVHQSQSARMWNWHVMVRRFLLLQESWYTHIFFTKYIYLSLSLVWSYCSWYRISMSDTSHAQRQ